MAVLLENLLSPGKIMCVVIIAYLLQLLFWTFPTNPEFHARESVINQRVKSMFEQKRQYKEDATRLSSQLWDTSNQLTDAEIIKWDG